VLLASGAVVTLGGFLLWSIPDTWLPAAAVGLPWTLPILALLAFVRLLAGVLQGARRVVFTQFAQFVLPPALLIVTATTFTLLHRLDASIALALYAASLMLVTAVSVLSVYTTISWPKTPVPAPTLALSSLSHTRISGFFLLNFGAVASANLGTLLLGTVATPSDAALFDLALRTSYLALLPAIVINSVIAPYLSELFALNDRRRIHLFTKHCGRLSFLSSSSCAIALAVLAQCCDIIGSYTIDSDFAETLTVLLAGQVFVATGTCTTTLLVMSRREHVAALILIFPLPLEAAFFMVVPSDSPVTSLAWIHTLYLAVSRALLMLYLRFLR